MSDDTENESPYSMTGEGKVPDSVLDEEGMHNSCLAIVRDFVEVEGPWCASCNRELMKMVGVIAQEQAEIEYASDVSVRRRKLPRDDDE